MKDTDLGFKNFSKMLNSLSKTTIEAGVFNEAGTNPKSGQSIAEYALYNEYGTENIPARPFMSLTADSKGERWTKLMTDCFDQAIENEGKNIERNLGKIGEQIVGNIKETISSNISPVNASSTVKQKGSSRTLIDTGTLRAAISNRVVVGQGG